MSAANKTNARKAESLAQQKKALELRRMGFGYTEIGEKIGLSKSQAHRLVTAAMAETRAEIENEAADLKAEELSRLDGMLAAVWPDARRGVLGAVDRVLKISERRAKLLGLDAPVKLAGPTGGAIVTRQDGIDPKALTNDELAQLEAIVAASDARKNTA